MNPKTVIDILVKLIIGWKGGKALTLYRHITVVNRVSVSQWLWHWSANCWLHCTVL